MRIRPAVLSVLAMSLFVACIGDLRGQTTTYATLPSRYTKWTDAMLDPDRTVVIDMILHPDAYKKEVFENFFRAIVLPQFTMPDNMSRLPEYRLAFFKQILWLIDGQPARFNEASKLVYDTLRPVVLGKDASGIPFNPTAQINALHVIGALKQNDENGPPMAESVELLARIARAGNAPEALRPIALGCLARDGARIPAELKPKVGAAMLTFLQMPSPAGRDPRAHDYLQRRAIEVLALMGPSGMDAATVEYLVATVKDPQNSAMLRAEAALALGPVDWKAAKVPVRPLLDAMGGLALAGCKVEVANQEQFGGLLAVSRIKQILTGAKAGITGIAAAATGDDQLQAKKLSTQVDTMLAACAAGPTLTPGAVTNDEATQKILIDKFRTLIAELQALLPNTETSTVPGTTPAAASVPASAAVQAKTPGS